MEDYMQMKTIKIWILLAASLLLTVGCANDDTTNKEKQQAPVTESLTAFVVEDVDAATRTTGEYDGSGVAFYWTKGDRLWVNNAAATPTLKQDARNNISDLLVPSTIPNGVQRTATAKFYFEGDYTASSYPVRYTGKNSTQGDKVTIAAQQNQTVANDASHIGESGDCGVATATKSGGRYSFTLDHKATYLTFMPYTSQAALSGVVVTQIKVTADKAIAGLFDFNDDGIDLATRPTPTAANRSITLTLKSTAATTGFPIPNNEATPGKNAAIMVLAPGIYGTLTVEYTLHDNTTGTSNTIIKAYNNITLNAGKNRRVMVDLQKDIHPGKDYYMWDAVKPYWYDRNLPDVLTNEFDYSSYGAPTSSDADRWHNTGYNGEGKPFDGTHSCAVAPNANELWYYVRYGDPHYVSKAIWSYNGHLYEGGGLWVKKQAVIFRELKDKGYKLITQNDMKARFYESKNDDGRDYCKTFNNTHSTPKRGTPANISDYFFLPALGWFDSGHLRKFGRYGYYWSKSADPHDSGNACYISFYSERMELENDDRDEGFVVSAFE